MGMTSSWLGAVTSWRLRWLPGRLTVTTILDAFGKSQANVFPSFLRAELLWPSTSCNFISNKTLEKYKLRKSVFGKLWNTNTWSQEENKGCISLIHFRTTSCLQVFFVESICDDPEIIAENIKVSFKKKRKLFLSFCKPGCCVLTQIQITRSKSAFFLSSK